MNLAIHRLKNIKHKRNTAKKAGGYTIPELITVLVITGIMVTSIMVFTFSYWSQAYRLQVSQELIVDRMNASDFIRENIGATSGLIIQNGLIDAYPNTPDTTYSPQYYWLPIHAIPGTKTITGSGSTPLVYYRRFSVNTSGNIIMNGTQPYEDEFVLYVDNDLKTIRLRSIANTAAVNNKLFSSCPDSVSSPSCPPDKKIIENVSAVTMRYFSRSGNLIDYTSSVDSSTGEFNGPDFTAVEVLEIAINLTSKTTLQTNTSNSTVIRIALRNT